MTVVTLSYKHLSRDLTGSYHLHFGNWSCLSVPCLVTAQKAILCEALQVTHDVWASDMSIRTRYADIGTQMQK